MKELEMGKNVNISEEKFEEILNKIYSVLKTLNFMITPPNWHHWQMNTRKEKIALRRKELSKGTF